MQLISFIILLLYSITLHNISGPTRRFKYRFKHCKGKRCTSFGLQAVATGSPGKSICFFLQIFMPWKLTPDKSHQIWSHQMFRFIQSLLLSCTCTLIGGHTIIPLLATGGNCLKFRNQFQHTERLSSYSLTKTQPDWNS